MKYGRVKNFIDGAFVDINSSRILTITSPVDGTPLTEFPCSGRQDVDRAVVSAQKAFVSWSKTTIN
jgi:malonate-semialdehyde dehydrogenase (acetylating)/methylmalonate-semialdehyde dehydrogenase